MDLVLLKRTFSCGLASRSCGLASQPKRQVEAPPPGQSQPQHASASSSQVLQCVPESMRKRIAPKQYEARRQEVAALKIQAANRGRKGRAETRELKDVVAWDHWVAYYIEQRDFESAKDIGWNPDDEVDEAVAPRAAKAVRAARAAGALAPAGERKGSWMQSLEVGVKTKLGMMGMIEVAE